MQRRDVYAHPPPPARRTDATRVSRRALLGLRMTGHARAEIDWASAAARVRAHAQSGRARPLLDRLEPVRSVLRGFADGCEEVLEVDAAIAWAPLPHPDAAFDAVLSAFTLADAPHPLRALEELTRVCRPGGVVAVAAWVPRGLPGRLPEYAEQVAPLPDGVPPPAGWGREPRMSERLATVLDDVEIRTRTVRVEGLDAEELFDALAPATLTAEQRDELRPVFERLLASSSNAPDRVELDARYLAACGRRRG